MSIQQISALARGLKQADPHDDRLRTASLARIDELRTLLNRAGCAELVCCLDAASSLTRMSMEDEGPSPTQLMDVVAKLVEAVDSAFRYENPELDKVREMTTGLQMVGDEPEEPTAEFAADPVPLATAREPLAEPEQDASADEEQSPDADSPGLSLGASIATPQAPQKPRAQDGDSSFGVGKHVAPRRATAHTEQDAAAASAAGHTGGALPLLNEMIFGELMIQLGHITREELNVGLDRQAAKGGLLGQVLIDDNVTTWDVVENVLRFQRMMNKDNDAKDDEADDDHGQEANANSRREMPSMLGEVTVHLGFAELEQVEEAVRVHRATGIRMGEALVQVGALTWPQLRESLRVQHNLRYAAGHANVSSPKFGLPAASKANPKLI